MPDTALPALLPVKLETTLVAWLRAKRHGALPGDVTIAGAHEPGIPAVPNLILWCSGSRPHPDFDGVSGSGWPRLCTIEFTLRIHKALDFRATASRWAAGVQQLLDLGSAVAAEQTGDRAGFAGLMADLNVGGAFHPADGLHIFDVSEAEDSLIFRENARLITFGLEFTAQSGDASPE